MKIYTITHKDFNRVTNDDLYLPLLVGANKNNSKEIVLKDNLFEDNISDKNFSFCELTGMYWIWKHSEEEVVGIAHYRRYFTKRRYLFRKQALLGQKDIESDLTKFDMIASLRGTGEILGNNTRDYFYLKHDKQVWEDCKKIIEKKYPEYQEAFEWYEQQSDTYVCNMIIMKKPTYDLYCEWLFDILFELDTMIDYSKYDDYNKRMIGFVAERLQNVWIKKHNLSVKEYPIYFTEDTFIKRGLLKVRQYFKRK